VNSGAEWCRVVQSGAEWCRFVFYVVCTSWFAMDRGFVARRGARGARGASLKLVAEDSSATTMTTSRNIVGLGWCNYREGAL
jgi:hypothetical protein